MASYNYMMSADEVAQELNCSKSHAYKLVKAMNKELSTKQIEMATKNREQWRCSACIGGAM